MTSVPVVRKSGRSRRPPTDRVYADAKKEMGEKQDAAAAAARLSVSTAGSSSSRTTRGTRKNADEGGLLVEYRSSGCQKPTNPKCSRVIDAYACNPPNCAKKPSIFMDLPDVLLGHVLSYAAPPTERAAFLCRVLSLLSSSVRRSIENDRSCLWSTILHEDYGGVSGGGGGGRRSKRLKRTPKEEVADAQRLLIDRTEIAQYALSEMIHSSRATLTLPRLRWIIREYGPILRINQRSKVGTTFLVECCRARHVNERVILRCIRELIEIHGALPDISAAATGSSSIRGKGGAAAEAGDEGRNGVTALCVASARAMPSVVKYLVQNAGASVTRRGSGRFRLYSNAHKSVCGTLAPLGFARAMKEAELRCGLDESEMKELDKCIELLAKAEATAAAADG